MRTALREDRAPIRRGAAHNRECNAVQSWLIQHPKNLCHVQMHIHADYTSERIMPPNIAISFVDESSGDEYELHLSKVTSAPWQLPMVGSEERFGTPLFPLHPVNPTQQGVGWLLFTRGVIDIDESLFTLVVVLLAHPDFKCVLLTQDWCCHGRCHSDRRSPGSSRLEPAR